MMGIIVSRSIRKTITVMMARNIQIEEGIGILNIYFILISYLMMYSCVFNTITFFIYNFKCLGLDTLFGWLCVSRLAHAVKCRFPIGFDGVVRAVLDIGSASNIYYEHLPVKPRVFVAIGEKYYIRAGNALIATTIVIERPGYTEVKVVTGGGKKGLLDLFDLGSSKDYAYEIIESISRRVGIKPVDLIDIDYMDAGKSSNLWTKP